jgi:cytochrome c peroxidase
MKVKPYVVLAGVLIGAFLAAPAWAANLGLPEVPVPADNPQTPEKIALGDKLFNDKRFSSTGEVSCATCHDPLKAGTDSPLKTSEGINKLTGTRNAPPVLNAAFNKTQFWDGRSPSLEDQARHPPVNPVEMGLPSHEPIVEIVNSDPEYLKAFENVFGAGKGEITIEHVTQAIAAFERTQVAGDSAWDRWYFGGQQDAVDESVKRGFQVFLAEGRCISCHAIEQNFALFTDHLFHNIGVGINDIQPQVPELATAFLKAKAEGADVDVTVLTNPDVSHLGRFAVVEDLTTIGAFKTPTLRNVALTAPYMHDGSLATLRDVVVHYNNGGVSKEGDPINPFLSGGIRPLNLTEEQIDDLVAFMEALTSAGLQTQQAMTTGDRGAERVAGGTVSGNDTRREGDS